MPAHKLKKPLFSSRQRCNCFLPVFQKTLKQLVVYLLVFSLLVPQGLFGIWLESIEASSAVFSSRTEWNTGEFDDVESFSNHESIKLKADGAWENRETEAPEWTIGNPGVYTSDGKYVYALRATADNEFYRYSPKEDSWKKLTRAPLSLSGGDIEYINGDIYVLFGAYQNAFYKYNIATETWSELATTPELMTNAQMTTDGADTIYATRGNTELYKYVISTDTWSILPPFTYAGRHGSLIYDNGNLYHLYNTSGAKHTWYQYRIADATKTRMADAPYTMNGYNPNWTVYNGELYAPRAAGTRDFVKYNFSSNTWTVLAQAPSAVTNGGVVYNAADNTVYFYRGSNSYDVWRYKPSTNSYLGVSDIIINGAINTVGRGSDTLYYDGRLYTLRGLNTRSIYSYDIASDEWVKRNDYSSSFNTSNQYMRGAVANGNLYFFTGSGATNQFVRYNVDGDTWTAMATSPTTVTDATVVYPGSGDYLYVVRGSWTRNVWRYSISGDTWDDDGMPDLPTGAYVGNGNSFSTDGSNLYLTSGLGISRFWKFDISENSWSSIARTPFSPYIGADSVYVGNNKILATAGNYDTTFWEYDTVADSWRSLPEMSSMNSTEVGVYEGSAIEVDPSGNVYVTRGASTTYVMKYTHGDYNYKASGTWTSGVIDLGYTTSLDSISATEVKPGDSSIVYETRSSSDSVSWSSWQALDGSSIQSPSARYVQVRANLIASTDRTVSPEIYDLSVNYVGDVTAPGNPTGVIAKSTEVSGVQLTSGQTYSYLNPFFSWSGASDSETQVVGYYVYFGPSSSATPQNDGSFQAVSTYSVTEPISAGSYNLLIQTKDAAGNVSSPLNIFNYVYSGIPADKSFSMTSSDDFDGGEIDGVSIVDDEIRLSSKENGMWLQERLSSMPAGGSYGSRTAAYVESTNKVYIFRGGNNTTFYEYDVDDDVWTALAPAPEAVYIGGGVIEGPDGFLYGMRGNSTNTFWRYSIADDTWDDAAAMDTPNTVYYGSSMIYDGSRYIYASRGNTDDSFWRYDTLADNWETLADVDFGAPNTASNNYFYAGGDITYDGNDTIYAIQGYTQANFASYSISQNTWTVMDDLPTLAYLGSSIAYDSSTNGIFYTAGYSTADMYHYDIDTSTWSEKTDAPATVYYGSEILKVGNSLFVFRGGGSNLVWKYKIATDYWQVPNRGIFGKNYYGASYDLPSYGANVVKGDGNFMYLTRGNYSNNFSRYDTVTGEVVMLDNLPSGSMYGHNLQYNSVNNKIYYVATLWQKFFVYDIATNTWSEDDDPPALSNQYGTTLTFDGERYMYWTRGGGSEFYRYDYLSESGSRWSTMANIPRAGNTASLVYKDGYIYAIRGDNTLSFYRYEVASDTWSDPVVADLPSTTYRGATGSALADGGDGYLYLIKGENTNRFLRYSISEDSWEVLPNIPAQASSGSDFVNGSDGRLYLLAANGTDTYVDGLYVYIVPSTTQGFEDSGVFISKTINLGEVYRWSNLRLSYTSSPETTLIVETRTSSDGSVWSGWSRATAEKVMNSTTYEYKINSPVNPNIQVKISLSSIRGIWSGKVSDFTINYVQDTLAPQNPAVEGVVVYSSATNSAQLSSGNWYSYPSINITWPSEGSPSGATDTATGSGVLGYYAAMFATESGNPINENYFQEENSMITSGLVSGQTYHFALTTVDEAGNINEEILRPFEYKFDNVAPTQPDDLSADPSGYTAVNSYSFSWSQATDSASGVSGYCYKTGASTGDYATERCTTELELTGVPSYRKGANTFYLRAKDSAGNYSAYSTVSYYFNDDSPSPPQNLTVSPETSETNSFEFSWSAPEVYYGNVSNLRYYYSVNALPSVANVQETPLTRLIPGSYATLPGENTFYIVAKDEAGNIDYKQYALVTFNANTAAPGMPENMDIADVSVKATKAWKIAVTWQEPSDGGENVASYQVWRSEDGGSVYEKIASTGGISYVDTGLEQLTYYYKIKACDSANNCGAFGSEVFLYPDGKFISPAALVDEPVVTGVTTKKAVVSWSTDRTSDSKIAYGVSSGEYIDSEVGNSSQVISHRLEITNLAPGTKYYYVTKWTDEDGNMGTSEEQTFETSPAPSAKEVVAKNIGLDKATINFTSVGASKAVVVYGKSTAFGGTTELSISATEATYGVYLEGLEDGTKYFYRVDLYDVDGAVYPGDIYSFETLPRPKISNVKLQQVKGTATSTFLVTWSSNTEVSSIVTHYPSSSPSMVKDEVDIKMTKAHRMMIKGLLSNTSYTMIVKGRDKGGNEAISEAITFTTASDTRPPEISNLNTEMTIVGVGEEATAQLIVSWETDEISTSQVMFGEGSTSALNNKTQSDSAPVYTHLVVIQNLSPSKVYRLKAVSVDKENNVAESADTVVITPKATQSALNLVVGNLSQAFGFLGGLVGTE